MTWKSEAKEITRNHYGNYCNLCRSCKTPYFPYCDDNWKIHYTELKQRIKNNKKQQ